MKLTVRKLLICAALLSANLGTSVSSCAQDAGTFSIQVETNEVLVPVSVFDKDLLQSQTSSPLFDADVRNLTARDFRLFEDGIEQKIRRVVLRRSASRKVRDNLGSHYEWRVTPTGRWSTIDLELASADFSGGDYLDRGAYSYVIAYPRPQSPEGSCHRIDVKVARTRSKVYFRRSYCNIRTSVSDPLRGSKLSKEMENFAGSDQAGKIPVSGQSGVFYREGGSHRVHITIEFPWNKLRRSWEYGPVLYADIAVLGLIYRTSDRELVARFTDKACCDEDHPILLQGQLDPSASYRFIDPMVLPTRFETAVDVVPGEYEAQVILTDGKNFGRARLPIVVENRDDKVVGLSSVLLGKRYHRVFPAHERGDHGSWLAPLVSNDIEVVPAGETVFRHGEPLIAYFEVYPPEAKLQGDGDVQARLRVVDEKSRQAKVDIAISPKATREAVVAAWKIETDTLPAGTYRVEVQVSNSNGARTGWRVARFTLD